IESPKYGTFEVLINDFNYERVTSVNWSIKKCGYSFYAHRQYKKPDGTRSSMTLHSFIMGKKEGFIIDHIDRNPLNCMQENMRFCTPLENSRNASKWKPKNITTIQSKYIGVHWAPDRKLWRVSIYINKKRTYVGKFKDEDSAARCRDYYALIH